MGDNTISNIVSDESATDITRMSRRENAFDLGNGGIRQEGCQAYRG